MGGAERSVQGLAEKLVALGNEVSVICVSEAGARSQLNGVNVHRLPLANVDWPFRDQRSLAVKAIWHAIDTYNLLMGEKVGKVLDVEQPNVVHTNNLSGFSVAVWREAKRRSIPIVHTLWDVHLLCPRMMFRRCTNCDKQCTSCKIISFPKRIASHAVDQVVGISRYILTIHRAHGYFSHAEGTVIHNSFKGPATLRPKESRRHVRLGFIGSLAPHKGINLLLETFVSLELRDRAQLWVAGEGKAKFVETLRARFRTAQIRFLGRVVPDEFYSEIDVLVVPSLSNEALGRVIFEAYAYGVPTIASRRGGIPELVEEGRTGYVFDPADLDGFKKMLLQVVSNPVRLQDMREGCLRKAQQFAPELIARRYEDVYEHLVQVRGITCKP